MADYSVGERALEDFKKDDINKHSSMFFKVETVLGKHALVAESAVVGFPHEVKGESICAFVTLKEQAGNELKNDPQKQV